MEKIFLPYGEDKMPLDIPQKILLKICWLKSIKNKFLKEIN